MNDPHVVALVYRIKHDDSIDYKDAEPFCHDEQAFRLEAADGVARFEMHRHFPTIEAADESLTEYLRAWEFDAQLRHGPDTFRLIFDRQNSEIIDRNPTPGYVLARPLVAIARLGRAQVLVKPTTYPEPPSDITLNLDAETMHYRYMGYRKGREPLASMANFCLTFLEYSTGKESKKRPASAKKYGIAKGVLSKIGELADTKGGKEARKRKGVEEDFSAKERKFLEQAVKAIVRRMAESPPPSGTLTIISMSDLLPSSLSKHNLPETAFIALRITDETEHQLYNHVKTWRGVLRHVHHEIDRRAYPRGC